MTATGIQIPAHYHAAMQAGAECWRCPLMGASMGGPVPPTLPHGHSFLVVAEAPGVNEVETGTTLVGASGKEVRRALQDAGMEPNDAGYTNAILCLDGHARVRLADGSSRSIRDVVLSKDVGPVLALSADGRDTLVAAEITGWHRSHRAGREMRQLQFHHARSATQGPSSIRLTYDHTVLTENHGWVRAADVAGEQIATGQKALAGNGFQIVLGTLLGDAGIDQSRMTFLHAADQEQYARLKSRALQNLGATTRRAPPAGNNVQDRIITTTRATRWMTYLERAFYPEGKKRLGATARALLASEFSDLLLAVWFCDDGYTRIRPGGRRPACELATNCFDRDDVEFLQRLLAAHGIPSHTRVNRGLVVVMDVDASDTLLQKIAPYVPPDLAYKLPTEYRTRFSASAFEPSPLVTFWDTAVVAAAEPRSDVVYCIDVAATQNFVTTAGVVHNCRPPGDLKKYLQQCKKAGKTSPIDACRPRLNAELSRARFALLMGSASVVAAGVPKAAVMSVRGTPLQTANGTPAIATPHAAFVMRDDGARYRPVFHADIAKAVRISRSGSTWRDPWYFVPKTAQEVANFLAVDRPRVAVDVETDGIDPWTCGMRRIGIGTDKEVMVYSPLSVKGHMLLSDDERIAQTRVIADYFRRAPRLDVHNGIAFDSVILHRHGAPLPDENTFDEQVGHQIGLTSELPHKLDFLGSMYTDAPFWKNTFKHSTVKDDSVLDKYLSFDIAVTHTSAGFVERNLIASNQVHVYTIDAELYRIGRSMAALGIYIDPAKRFAFAQEYQEKSDRLRAEFVQAAGRDINPASYPQIRKLLYEDLGLPILDDHITDSDEPSTDENTLLDLLEMGVDKRAQTVIHALFGFREAEKILGTNTGHVVEGRLEGGPPVHLDGRLRTSWRPGKTTGRWGSSDPVNLTNIPKKLRAMFIPAPGNVFVAADMQAVELRAIAILAGDAPLIQAFAAFDGKTGPDVHIANACGVFGCTPEQVTDTVRNFIKRFVYALSYGAEPLKIYQTLSLLRTDDLQPMFPGITLQHVERAYNNYWKLHPAIQSWRKRGIYAWRAQRYMETATHKRKRYFIGGESPTEMANFPIQGICADMQNDAIRAIVRAYPFDYARHRGLVLNVHDQLVVECGAEEAEMVKGIVRTVMEKRIGEMRFPAEPKAAGDWKAVS